MTDLSVLLNVSNQHTDEATFTPINFESCREELHECEYMMAAVLFCEDMQTITNLRQVLHTVEFVWEIKV